MTDSTSRHKTLWGEAHLAILQSAHVVLAGVGGLGGTVAESLVRSGVGRLSLADWGTVAVTDLNRQILYAWDDVGQAKVTVAARRLQAIAPQIRLRTWQGDLASPAGRDWLGEDAAGVYVDGLDSLAARYALEDALPHGAVLVHGGVGGSRGQIATLRCGQSPSLRELYAGVAEPEQPVAVIPQICAVTGAMMALAVVHALWLQAGLCAGPGPAAPGTLLQVDTDLALFTSIRLA